MVNSSDFGNRLQKILDFYNISATELSNQISFNRSTISHLLSGRNKPSLDFVMKVLQKFPEVELYWLLNGKGSFPKNSNNEKPIPSTSNNKQEINTLPLKKEIDIKVKDSQTKAFSDNFDDKSVDRIVIFFKDGSFKSYKN